MPKPRVFISSTFYDLKHIRASLESFVEQLGFEPVLSEKGSIAYDPDLALDESCYREVRSTDIFVLIVGGRYGSEASAGKTEKDAREFYDRFESITKREYETSVERDLPTYILIEKAVYAEYQTFKSNRDNATIHYAHVDSVNVFHFLDHILTRPRNNPIYQFERHIDIQAWLREQWAGLFRELLSRRSESKQLASLADQVAEMSNVSTTLKRYLETVVAKVGGPTRDAEKLIKTEERRLDDDRRKRAALKVGIVSNLRDSYNVPEEKVLSIFSDATSLEDLLRRIVEATDDAIDYPKALTHWHDSPKVVVMINRAREHLGKPPLVFAEPPKEPRVSKSKRRRSP